jgi:hypothetical protein
METSFGDGRIYVSVKEANAQFKRIRVVGGEDIGRGEFFMHLDVTALKEDVYIPLSLASGKKPTGFVYQIEGTAQGSIATSEVSCKGDGITKVVLGTLVYAKIPKGSIANFRIAIDMRGVLGREYKVGISRINYKLNPDDARYKKFDALIETKMLKFK